MSKQQDAFLARRFGVFNHFLYSAPSSRPDTLATQPTPDWNACVEHFDVEDMARRLHAVGAGYYWITIMQGRKYMLAPNAAFDAIAGTKPGEACAHRDLIADLAEALARYDIDLFLYFTGDGPYLDVEIGKKFGLYEPRKHVTMNFVAKWASVLREYAMRYGTGVKGWWIDGCYRDFLGYTEELLTPYYEACKAGNPDCLVAMNNGVKPDFRKYYSKEEITAGEFNDFAVLPPSRFIDGAQAHILAPLGVSADGSEWGGWRRPGLKRSKEYMLDYVRRANAVGMPVTIDIFVGHDASWDAEQKAALQYIGERL